MSPREQPAFGELLRRYRLAVGLTQQELAERARVSAAAISALERGTRQAPYRETVALLCDALGLRSADRAVLTAASTRARAPSSSPVPLSGHATAAGPAGRPLPAPLTSFLGREQELGALGRFLGERRRLLTLTGAGGVGKTRLAIEAAQAAERRFLDGVWFVDLAPLTDPALVPQAVATVLHLRDALERPPTQAVTAWLAPRSALLVLDNCEHVLVACAALVAPLLRDCPRVSVLATSREQLGIGGEQVYEVPPLALPPPDLPSAGLAAGAALLAFASVRLFVERAQAARSTFALTGENAAAIVTICRRLDGLPLAIELAAAWVRVLSPDQIAARLRQRFQLLTTAPREAPARQQTLRALIDWSYELLSEADRAVLRRLAVFAGGWTLDAAEALCSREEVAEAAVLVTLSSLVDKSLVVAETRGTVARYSLLESIRAYAAEKLAATDEAITVGQRHGEIMLQLARAARRELVGSAQAEWVERLEQEHHNLRAALAWALTRDEPEPALRLCAALSMFWYIKGHYSEGRAWIARALARAPQAPSRARVAALHGAASLAGIQHDHTEARAQMEASVALWRTVGDRRGMAAGLAELGMHARHQGDFAAARRACEEALAIYATAPDPWGQRLALGVLGWVAEAEGDQARARRLLEQSLVAARAAHSPIDVALQLNNLGILAHRRGDDDEAMRRHAEALRLSRDVGAREPMACSLEGLAGVAAASGQHRRAGQLLGAAAAVRAVIGAPRIAPFEEEYRHLVPALRAARGEPAFTAALAEDGALSAGDVAALALEAMPHGAAPDPAA